MPGRSYTSSTGYRYGFGGQEKDDEISGSGNSYTAEFWQYDPRLGRRWNIDPIVKPWVSSYAAFNNNPIYFNDPSGLDPTGPDKVSGPNDDCKPGDQRSDGTIEGYRLETVEISSEKIPNGTAQVVYQVGKLALYESNLRSNYYNKGWQEAVKMYENGLIKDQTLTMLRYQLQKATRMQQTPPGRAVSEVIKPSSAQKALAEGYASDPNFKFRKSQLKTSIKVTTASKVVSKVLVVGAVGMSVTNVVTAEDKGDALASEGAIWGSTLAGAEIGSAAGPWGAFLGGVGGALFGEEFVEEIKTGVKAWSAGAGDHYQRNKEALAPGGNFENWVCFTKGTMVYSKNGLIPIEDVKIGDSVYSYNVQQKIMELKKVQNTLNQKAENIFKLKAANESIFVTATHPFYVVGKGWTIVADLKIGDKLLSSTGLEYGVDEVVKQDKELDVYNIEVEGNNNFYITNATILVHNKNITFLKQLEEEKRKAEKNYKKN